MLVRKRTLKRIALAVGCHAAAFGAFAADRLAAALDAVAGRLDDAAGRAELALIAHDQDARSDG